MRWCGVCWGGGIEGAASGVRLPASMHACSGQRQPHVPLTRTCVMPSSSTCCSDASPPIYSPLWGQERGQGQGAAAWACALQHEQQCWQGHEARPLGRFWAGLHGGFPVHDEGAWAGHLLGQPSWPGWHSMHACLAGPRAGQQAGPARDIGGSTLIAGVKTLHTPLAMPRAAILDGKRRVPPSHCYPTVWVSKYRSMQLLPR